MGLKQKEAGLQEMIASLRAQLETSEQSKADLQHRQTNEQNTIRQQEAELRETVAVVRSQLDESELSKVKLLLGINEERMTFKQKESESECQLTDIRNLLTATDQERENLEVQLLDAHETASMLGKQVAGYEEAKLVLEGHLANAHVTAVSLSDGLDEQSGELENATRARRASDAELKRVSKIQHELQLAVKQKAERIHELEKHLRQVLTEQGRSVLQGEQEEQEMVASLRAQLETSEQSNTDLQQLQTNEQITIHQQGAELREKLEKSNQKLEVCADYLCSFCDSFRLSLTLSLATLHFSVSRCLSLTRYSC